MRLEGPDVEEHISRLIKEDKGPFREAFEENLEEIGEDSVASTIDQRLFRRRKHVSLVKAIASGFNSSQDPGSKQSGYYFDSTDPLCLTRTTGGDALLARKESNRIHLCVVVCEVSDGRIPEWIENVNSAVALYEQQSHQDSLKELVGFPDKKLGSVQYILLSRQTDLEQVPLSKIADKVDATEFAIWSAQVDERTEVCHRYGNSIHKDLRDSADGCFDWADGGENPIKYTVETHPIIPLKNVLFELIKDKKMIQLDENPLEFNKKSFREEYRKYLQTGYTGKKEEQLVNEATSEMFELGEQIEILSKSDTNTVRDYRVMFQPGNSDDPKIAREQTEQKYIDLATDIRRREIAFKNTKEEFDSLQSGLGDWADGDDDGDDWNGWGI